MDTIESLREYATALGMTFQTFQFDCGTTIAARHPTTGFAIRVQAECGDERRAYGVVRRAFDLQPWPTEDDPRVITEGSPV